MSDGRAIILGRIREALRNNPAPRPHVSHSPQEASEQTGGHPQRAWLPEVSESPAEQIALFEKNSEALKTELHQLPDLAAAREKLSEIAVTNGWQQIASHGHPDTEALLEGFPLPVLKTDLDYKTGDLEQCDAGVSGCEVLVAQTGSILVSVKSSGGRALSVLPPHHVVIARTNQMVPDLTAAFGHLGKRYGREFPSFLSFITGPSRTGDIERILVLGAHGPKRLTVLLLGE